MDASSIRNPLKATGWALCLTVLLFGCAKQNSDAIRFSDSCFDVPSACGAVYSADGKYLALATVSKTSNVEQVYRVRLDRADAKPELVSIDGDGHVSNGNCINLRFLPNNDLVFQCASTNLLEGSGTTSFRKTGDAPLEAYSSP